MLVENADIAGFNRYTVLNLHSALAENLLPNPADEGRTRQHLVEIGKSVYRPADGARRRSTSSSMSLLDKAQPRSKTPSSSRSSRWCICRTCSRSPM